MAGFLCCIQPHSVVECVPCTEDKESNHTIMVPPTRNEMSHCFLRVRGESLAVFRHVLIATKIHNCSRCPGPGEEITPVLVCV